MTSLATIDLTGFRLGMPQRVDDLTVVPVFGPAYPGVLSPRDGVKLVRVDGYGTVVLRNPGSDGVAIVPLHVGYVQDGAQNHALCRSAFLAPGQEVRFEDACCVQESTGGYLTERDQWFFTLPLELRARALELRGQGTYSKLWPTIQSFNRSHGLRSRGHLELMLAGNRAFLTQYRSRLELVPGQLGALFITSGRVVGLEVAPNPAYFADVWPALVCFTYGPTAMRSRLTAAVAPAEPYEASTVDELVAAREAQAHADLVRVRGCVEAASRDWADPDVTEEERYLDLRLSTVVGAGVAGQIVSYGSRPVYASLFVRQMN
jgi:hypothetical protein